MLIDSYVSNVKTESYETLPDGISCGWCDSEEGREGYTIEQINEGILGDKIIFNTIVIPDEDKHKYPGGTVSNEKNFVAVRVDNGSYGSKNVWEGNLIEVAEGEQYMIRIYCYNNSLKGSALLENNGIGSRGGKILDDKIVNESWTKIGYSALDGKIPGCYQYDSYLTIRVRPIF